MKKKRESPPAKPFQREQQAARLLDIPMDVLPWVFRLELSGNRQATVTGCRGIQAYSPERISLDVGKMVIHFQGDGLEICQMLENTVVIQGTVIQITLGNL